MERLAIDHSVTPPSIGGSPAEMDGSPTFDGGYSPASLDGAAALISPDEAREMDFLSVAEGVVRLSAVVAVSYRAR